MRHKKKVTVSYCNYVGYPPGITVEWEGDDGRVRTEILELPQAQVYMIAGMPDLEPK